MKQTFKFTIHVYLNYMNARTDLWAKTAPDYKIPLFVGVAKCAISRNLLIVYINDASHL